MNLLFVVVLLSSPDSTSSSGSDKTNLATGRGSSFDSRGFTNMLMVTTTVRMLNRVHSNTTNLGPAVALDLVFVVGTASLQHGFVNTSTAGNNSDHSAVGGGNNLNVPGQKLNQMNFSIYLLGARWELDSGPLSIRIVGDDGGVIARSTGDTSTVAGLLLQVGDDGTLRHASDGHNVSDGQLSLLSAVNELASVHTFGGDKELLPDFVAVRIPKRW